MIPKAGPKRRMAPRACPQEGPEVTPTMPNSAKAVTATTHSAAQLAPHTMAFPVAPRRRLTMSSLSMPIPSGSVCVKTFVT